jgi:dimethylglycine dehydrogenase
MSGDAEVAPVNLGFYALNSLRMEKAYKAWGVELTVENTAWELGLDRFVSLGDRDFIGRDALIAQREGGLDKRFVYLEIEAGESDAIGGEALLAGDELVGVMVSGAYGHRVGKSLGFGLLDVVKLAAGRSLEAEIVGVRRRIRVIDEPAFDRPSRCPRA